MSKIKVSKRVADSLDYLLTMVDYKNDYENLMREHASTILNDDEWDIDALGIKDLSLLELANILQNVYKVKLTKEEKYKDVFEKVIDKIEESVNKSNSQDHAYYKGQMHGMQDALRILGIEINGVNR